MKITNYIVAILMWFTITGGLKAQTSFKETRAPKQCKFTSKDMLHHKHKLKTSKLKKTIVYGRNKYVIPVVFHVFGNEFSGGTTVTQEIIEDALRKTNEDFKGLTPDWNSINPLFDNVKEKIDITFKLAQIDPDGNACSGVTFNQYESGFGNTSGSNEKIQKYAWDNYKYMNVYIMWDLYGDSDYYNSGVAWYPTKWMSDDNLARVVYNGSYLGSNTDENFRSVLTHEFGHFFNLIHTFDGGCTYPNDEVADTPPVSESMFAPDKLNCEGKLTNTQNFMNYSNNYAMFTKGQVERMEDALQTPTRFPLWQKENLDNTLFDIPTARVLPLNKYIYESTKNDGSFNNTFVIKAIDAKITNSMLSKSDYSVSGLPDGLYAILKKQNDKLVLSVLGKAINHSELNNTSFTLNLKNSILDNGDLYQKHIKLNLEYRNPYKIVASEIINEEINATNSWKWFSFGVGNASFGIWRFDDGHIKFQSYSKKIITNINTKNITALDYNDKIDASSNWVKPIDEYKNVLDLRTDNYTNWQGKIAYAGVEFQIGELTHYGWVKFKCSSDGKSVKLIQWAYNEQNDAAIYAGQTSKNMTNKLLLYSDLLNESTENNGAVKDEIEIELIGAKFRLPQGQLNSSDVTFVNVPEGLDAHVKVMTNTSAKIYFTGRAVNHTEYMSVENMSVVFNKAAFKYMSDFSIDGLSQNISLKFKDPFKIVYLDNEDIFCNAENPWKSFELGSSKQWYGAFFNENNLRLETYKKNIVCYKGTENVKFLTEGTIINWDSDTWEVGGDFPDEHNIVTPTYTQWKGKTGYIGICIFIDSKPAYGWMQIKVNSAGTSYTILDMAYWDGPTDFIKAGQKKIETKKVKSDFSISSNNIDVNTAVRFTNLSVSSETIVDYTWTFDGGTPSSYKGENPPEVLFANAGSFNVGLRITDKTGAVSQKYSIVNVKKIAQHILESNFSLSSNNIDVNTSVTFTNTSESSDIVTDYTWTFDGGMPSSYKGENPPEVLFANAGSFNVGLRITDKTGAVSQKYSIVNVKKIAQHILESNFSLSSNNIEVNTSVTFTNTSESSDIVTDYTWTFDGGTPSSYKGENPPEVLFANAGSFNVGLRITDKTGAVSQKYSIVNVKKIAQHILESNFSLSSNNIDVNTSVTFTNTSESSDIVTDYTWTFDGGTPSSYKGENPPEVLFANAGSFNVGLRITDKTGSVSQKYNSINVKNIVNSEYCIPDIRPRAKSLFITKVGVNYKNNDSDFDGYKYFSNINKFIFYRNTSNTLDVSVSRTWDMAYVNVWFDWNNNGEFEESEKEFSHSQKYGDLYSSMSVPSNFVGDAVRMRVRLSYAKPNVTACEQENYIGEVEDYNVIVEGEKSVPAEIYVSQNKIKQGESTVFSCTAKQAVSEYLWTFTGSDTYQSSSANPSVRYSAAGVYQVELKLEYVNGKSETIVKENVVSVSKSNINVDFSISNTDINTGESVSFTDNSVADSNIVSWYWTFEGAYPSSFIGQYPPSVKYNAEGIFAVTLKLVDAFGNISTKRVDNCVEVANEIVNNYCVPVVYSNVSNFYISKVDINSKTVESNYNDYSFNGSNASFTLKRNNWNHTKIDLSVNWPSAQTTIWIDWNHDSVFSDNEKAYSFVQSDPYKSEYMFVPREALLGKTRMRVRLSYYSNEISACDDERYMGEIEDYTVYITSGYYTKSSLLKPEMITNNRSVNYSIFPNPTCDIVFVENEHECTIYVYDTNAKLVREVKSTSCTTKIDLNGLSKGTYIFKIISGDDETIEKIIKN